MKLRSLVKLAVLLFKTGLLNYQTAIIPPVCEYAAQPEDQFKQCPVTTD